LSLGFLTLDANGRGELKFVDEQGLDLIASYSGVELTIEPNPDTDPKSSGLVAYSFFHAKEGLAHLRNILAAYPNSPDQTAIIQGLYTDYGTIDEFAKEMQKAAANGNTDRVRLNAEAILNIMVGSQSPNRKDWNTDGQVDDPSDGFGLLLNGQNLGYLQAAYIEADTAVKSAGASEQMVTSGEGLKNSVQNLAQWTTQMQELLIAILASPAPADLDQKVSQAADLADRMLKGVDADEDGLVEPILNEGGAQVAYEQAYRMADMPLEAVGIQNLGTGTPTFIFSTATRTPGGGSSGGGSTNPTARIPPGQQKTPSNNKPPPKTKKPTGNTITSNTTNNNNGNGNGH
jgi:hypothetical protein